MKNKLMRKLDSLAKILESSDNNNFGLLDDNGGKILFFSYYYKLTKDKRWLNALEREVQASFDLLSTQILPANFCNGIAGYFVLFNFLQQEKLYDIDTKKAEEYYKKYLETELFSEIENGAYDFLYSSLGIAYYFLLVGDFQLIDKYLSLLFDKAIKDNNKLFWIDKSDPDRNFTANIGMAHGMSSIIIFLSKVLNQGINVERSIKLLQGSLNFILSQKLLESKNDNLYPSLSLNDKDLRSRLGWCYGDLMIGLAFWNAGKVLKDIKCMQEALKIFENTIKRKDLQSNFVVDPGLCHGTSGISLIFKRIYLETNDYNYYEAYSYWLIETLKMAKYHDCHSQYKYWSDGKFQPCTNSLLEGLSGIALVLLSYLAPNSFLEWDKLLLLH